MNAASTYAVEVVDGGRPWTYETEARSADDARAQARWFFGPGVVIVLVRLVKT